MLAFLYYLHLKLEVDAVVTHVYFDPKWDVKFKFASTYIQLVAITNLFAQKCQLCVLRENSNQQALM